MHARRDAVPRVKLRGRRLQPRRVSRDEQEVVPAPREPLAEHAADAGGRAGDDGGRPRDGRWTAHRPYVAVSVALASWFACRLNPTIAAVAFAGTWMWSVFSAYTVNT